MALQALNIVRETIGFQIERIADKMDNMVSLHARKVEYARFVMNHGFDSERARTLGIKDGDGYTHMRHARWYLESCGPALDEADTPDWITLPEKDLQKHGEYGRTAARLALLRDALMARIEKECIEQPDPHMEAVLDSLPNCSDCLDGVCFKKGHPLETDDLPRPAGSPVLSRADHPAMRTLRTPPPGDEQAADEAEQRAQAGPHCCACTAGVCREASHVEYDPTGSNLDPTERIPF